MRVHKDSLLLILVLFFLCMMVQGVFAWTVQDMKVKPSSGPVSPGTPVTVSFTVHFDTWSGSDGETFDSRHTLDMFTDLDDAQWTATLVNIDEDRDPITTSLGSRTGVRYRIDGWTLSYDSGELNLVVTLRGNAPKNTGERTMIRIEELDDGAEVVSGNVKTVKYQVAVPTTATTVRTQTQATVATTTRAPETTATTVTPKVKHTYTPGPDPVAIAGVLAFAGIVAHRIRRENAP